MKIQAFQVVQEDFAAQHPDDRDALQNAKKRIEYGKDMCTKEEWKFQYGQIDDDVSSMALARKRLIHKQNREHHWTFI